MESVRHTLPREQRLRTKRRIDLLFAQGEGGFVHPIRYKFFSETEAPEVRLLVVVPKRIHKRAHVRNLLKRRMREAFRLHKEPLREACRRSGHSLSLALLYTSDAVLDFATIEKAVLRILSALAEKKAFRLSEKI